MSPSHSGPIRSAVRRDRAEQYVLITLLAFGGSVILTRLFLELTGYPQIGNSELHIAHVIWGGLFLFVATLLPIIFANHWAMTWSAAAGGIGFGLFIDEVGKFITQSNDYFYPPAAPIIYTLFLITALVYIHIRRPKPTSPREELYRVLHGMTELLDNDLDATERAALVERLDYIQSNSDDPQELALARSLMNFVTSKKVITAPDRKPKIIKAFNTTYRIILKFFTRQRLRLLLIIGLGWVGVYSVIKLVTLGIFVSAVFTGVDFTHLLQPAADFEVANQPLWFAIRLAVQGLVGFLSMLAASLFLLKRDNTAANLGILGLTISLTVVNILIFYLDQFSASIGAMLEFALLLGVAGYRQHYLITPSSPIDPEINLSD